MQKSTDKYPILRTAFYFGVVGGLVVAVIYTSVALLSVLFNGDMADFTGFLSIFPMLFVSGLIFGLVFSWVNGIILALRKYKIRHSFGYLLIFGLGFLLSLPISYLFIVGFGPNKTFVQILLIITTFGFITGMSNVVAAKVVLPKIQ